MLVNVLHNVITLDEALATDHIVYVDMRSPSEYQAGHIPGAVNIPLFSDEERAIVGTTYKQVSTDDAKQQGLTFVSSKLPAIVEQIRQLCQEGGKGVSYCWRGGMRSRSVVSILDIMGVNAFQLQGGYKAYRRHILDSLTHFSLQPVVIVLCGSTGVGKTTLLARLAERGIPVLDLENLANHRGSAFGHVGLGPPMTAQKFDTALLAALRELNQHPFIVVECESKRIGNVYLPDVLYQAMQCGPKVLLTARLDIRIDRLIAEYTDLVSDHQSALAGSIESLRTKLGNKKTDRLLDDLLSGRIRDVVRTLLSDYYDPLYGYETADESRFKAVVSADDLSAAANNIEELVNHWRR